MYPFDFRFRLVNNTKESIGLKPLQDLSAGETRWLKTSEIRKLNRVRRPKWRIPVEVKDRPRLQGMTLDPRKHLLGMTVVVFAYESDRAGAGAGNIIARGLKGNFSRRFFPCFSSENEEDFTAIDLYKSLGKSRAMDSDLMG